MYFILPSISIVFSMSMILFSFMRGKKSSTTYSFIFCHAIMTLWTLGQILENASTNETQKWIATIIKYSAVTYIAASWLIFTLLYTNRIKNLRKACFSILVLPLLFNLAVLTNRFHYLFFSHYSMESRTYGILFWLHSIESYSYLIASIVILFITSFKCVKKHRIQYVLLAISILFPTILNILYVSRVLSLGTDLTPISFVLSSFIFFVAVFKYRFLNLLPVAITDILDAMPQVIIALDSNNEINYTNKAFQKFLPKYNPSVQNNIIAFKEYFRKKVYIDKKNLSVIDRIILEEKEPLTEELEFKWPNLNRTIIFQVNVIPIYEKGTFIGKVIIFNDITEYKHLINENIRKNESLSLMAQKLLEANLCYSEASSVSEKSLNTIGNAKKTNTI
ncbi:histidine kinase N-terminal 7TM domain-containing protein [Acetivibrio clariflavus]|uniref:histidine kinase N-terminal 7TM domain-containing protein n=1 Tax=Acetivibrio clariflavus TaxID=288965 RepID=UPI001FE18982|nr:histidine kinase N-terminal 7TM domain-containing protein [Acetivibrio clariflavus]